MTKFQAHVHPECYSADDPLIHRISLLHTSRSQCEAQWCTFDDHFDWAKPEHTEPVAALRKEIAAAKRAARKAGEPDLWIYLYDLTYEGANS